MKIGPLHPSSTFGLDPHSATQQAQTKEAQDTVQSGQVGAKGPIDPEKLRLAQEFEQIFIRKMLSSLEKSGRNGRDASASSSGDAYGSMVVSALAEAVSKGGGVGLAEMIARAASRPTAIGPASSTPTTTEIQAAITSATRETGGVHAATVGRAPITVPEKAHITVGKPGSATYARPVPTIILNDNHDIQKSFKDPDQ
jgi:Rod binding domain-containing protein